MSKIWFIRHGESNSNAGVPTTDAGSTELSPRGWQDAEAISERFTTAPDLIVAGPYIRTQQTAMPTAHRFPETKQEIWPIQEFGISPDSDYAGTTRHERSARVKEYWQRMDPDYVAGPGAESFNTMVGRIDDTLKRLQDRPEQFVAVFSHDRILTTLLVMLENPELKGKGLMSKVRDFTAAGAVPNGAIIEVIADADGVRLNRETTPAALLRQALGETTGPVRDYQPG